MKRNLMNVLAIGALASGAIFAQGGGPRGGNYTPPDPATMAAHQVERLTTVLTLTTAQQAQATTIFTNAANAEANLRTNVRTAQTSLQTAVQKNDTASIDNLASQIGSITGQEIDIQSKAEAAFYAILTADQKTKYSAVHGPGGFGGPGGPGGPGAMRRGPRQQ